MRTLVFVLFAACYWTFVVVLIGWAGDVGVPQLPPEPVSSEAFFVDFCHEEPLVGELLINNEITFYGERVFFTSDAASVELSELASALARLTALEASVEAMENRWRLLSEVEFTYIWREP